MPTAWVVTAGVERVAPTSGNAELTFTVTNPSPVQDRAVFEVVPGEGASREWFAVEEPQRTVPAGGSVTYLVKLTLPAEVLAGQYWLQGRVYSADLAPEESSVLSGRVAFDVEAAAPERRRWWLWIVPAAVVLAVVTALVVWLVMRDGEPVARGPVDLIELAPSATWRSGAGELSFPGNVTDLDRGLAMVREFTHENGTVDTVLYTHPELVKGGFIEGDFELPRPIAEGDRFTARIGFVEGSVKGEATFVVLGVDGEGATELGRIEDSSDDKQLKNFDVDLGRAKGATTLRLRVIDDAGSSAEWATTWLQPRIVG